MSKGSKPRNPELQLEAMNVITNCDWTDSGKNNSTISVLEPLSREVCSIIGKTVAGCFPTVSNAGAGNKNVTVRSVVLEQVRDALNTPSQSVLG